MKIEMEQNDMSTLRKATVNSSILLLFALRHLVSPAQGQVYCTVEADSVHSRFTPWRILDGDKAGAESRWASGKRTEPHWVAFRFAEAISLDRSVVYGHGEPELALADAEIQVKRNGKWQTVASVENNDKRVVEFRFDQAQTDAMRLYVTRACRRDSCVRLYEVEFFDGEKRIDARVTGRQIAHRPAAAPIARADLVASVRPFPREVLRAEPSGEWAHRLMQAHYDSILDWGRVLLEHIQPVPGHPEWNCYGLGGNRENDVRPICYAAFVNAFLCEVQPPTGAPSERRRARMRADAIATLRYLTQAHVSGEGACLNGKQWGNQWQSAMWTRAAGFAGWILWPDLDDQMRLAVARLVEYEADRFLQMSPKSSQFKDTGAEENAWNAQIVSLTCNMMPNHPRAKRWAETAKTYMYNTLSVISDEKDNTPGDDGRPVSEWVTTVNAHPDFTVENHGIVHVGYLKTSVAMLLEGSIHYLLVGAEPPNACYHNVADCFRVLEKCMAWDAAPIYFSGNDWKLVHTQCTDVIIYALVNVLNSDSNIAHDSAYLEDVALDYLRRIQHAEGGYYNIRRDIEFGGVAATRLIACYLAHAAAGEAVRPVSETDFNSRISNVTHLEHARAIVHRTPSKFASFSWGAKRMALAMPLNGSWVTWPHFASYIGQINGVDASEGNATLTALHHDVKANRFNVTGTLQRFDGGVTQDFSYVSLAKDVTVYIERLRLHNGFEIASRETGIIGHEYELGHNDRVLSGRHGTTRIEGIGGVKPRVIEMETDWLNIADCFGYVVRRLDGQHNLMRYHDQLRGSGRVPKLQEWLSLIGERNADWSARGTDWACLATFLNQDAAQTSDWTRRVQFSVDGDVATCRIGEDVIRVDFTEMETEITEPSHQSTEVPGRVLN